MIPLILLVSSTGGFSSGAGGVEVGRGDMLLCCG